MLLLGKFLHKVGNGGNEFPDLEARQESRLCLDLMYLLLWIAGED